MISTGRRQKIDKLFAILEARTNSLLDNLEEVEIDKLKSSDSPHVWSVMQVLSHLVISERLSAKYIEKKLSFDPVLSTAGIKAGVRLGLLKLYLILPFKFKAPKGVNTENLPEFSSLQQLKQVWNEDRTHLKLYLERLDDSFLNKEIYRHPVAGRLSLSQMLQFFEMHMRRHERQIYDRLS